MEDSKPKQGEKASAKKPTVQTCPHCGRRGTFLVRSTYYTKQGTKRVRECTACGWMQTFREEADG